MKNYAVFVIHFPIFISFACKALGLKEIRSNNMNSQNTSDCKFPRSKEKNVQKVTIFNKRGKEIKYGRSEWQSDEATAIRESRNRIKQEIWMIISTLGSQISNIDVSGSQTPNHSPDQSPVIPHSFLVGEQESLKGLIVKYEIEINNLKKHEISLREENKRLIVERQLLVEQSQVLHWELSVADAKLDSSRCNTPFVKKNQLETTVVNSEIQLLVEKSQLLHWKLGEAVAKLDSSRCNTPLVKKNQLETSVVNSEVEVEEVKNNIKVVLHPNQLASDEFDIKNLEAKLEVRDVTLEKEKGKDKEKNKGKSEKGPKKLSILKVLKKVIKKGFGSSN
jgi:hypothetical protein